MTIRLPVSFASLANLSSAILQILLKGFKLNPNPIALLRLSKVADFKSDAVIFNEGNYKKIAK